MAPAAASQTGRSLAPMLIYILMAGVLFFRPAGPVSGEAMRAARGSHGILANARIPGRHG